MNATTDLRRVLESGVRRMPLSRRKTIVAIAAGAVSILTFPVAWLVRSGDGSQSTSGSATRSTVDPNLVPPQSRQKGLELQREGKYDEAVREFTRIIESDPNALDAYLFRGIVRFNAGQVNESIADFSTVLARQPDNARAYLYRAESYLALGDVAKAERDVQAALDLAGDDPSLAVAARTKLQLLESVK